MQGDQSITMEESHGPIYALWIPVVVFAHLFAGFWLLRALNAYHPSLLHTWVVTLARAGRCCACGILQGVRSTTHPGTAKESAEAMLATCISVRESALVPPAVIVAGRLDIANPGVSLAVRRLSCMTTMVSCG